MNSTSHYHILSSDVDAPPTVCFSATHPSYIPEFLQPTQLLSLVPHLSADSDSVFNALLDLNLVLAESFVLSVFVAMLFISLAYPLQNHFDYIRSLLAGGVILKLHHIISQASNQDISVYISFC